MSKERIKWVKRFAEDNVMISRKLMNTTIPKDKKEIAEMNLLRLEESYKHPFQKIPEAFFSP